MPARPPRQGPLCLATRPDVAARDQHLVNTSWANSPVPVNLWRTQFFRTSQNPAARGRVNVTVVNTHEE